VTRVYDNVTLMVVMSLLICDSVRRYVSRKGAVIRICLPCGVLI
jgi:hypothetical protein